MTILYSNQSRWEDVGCTHSKWYWDNLIDPEDLCAARLLIYLM